MIHFIRVKYKLKYTCSTLSNRCNVYYCHKLIFLHKMTHHSMPIESVNNVVRMFESECEMKIDIFHDTGGNK